jgi:signal transduction histidine kinase
MAPRSPSQGSLATCAPLLAGLVALDVATGLTLGGTALHAVMLLTALLLLPLLARQPIAGLARGPLVCAWLLVIAAAATACASVWQVRRLETIGGAGDAGEARERVLLRAAGLEAEFRRALLRLAASGDAIAAIPPYAPGTGAAPNRSAAFDRLEALRHAADLDPERLGLSQCDREGSCVVWSGRSALVPAEILKQARPAPGIFLVAATPAATRLLHLTTRAGGETIAIAEYLVQAPLEEPATADLLPTTSRDHEPWEVTFQDSRRGAGGFEELFKRTEDRYWSEGPTSHPTLALPLRGPDGTILAVARLWAGEPRRDATALRRRGVAAAGAWLAAALLLAGIDIARRWRGSLEASASSLRHPWVRLVAASGLLWLARLLLAQSAFPQEIWNLGPFDFTVFGSSALAGLMRSPGDLAATALTLMAQALLLGMAGRSVLARLADRSPAPPPRSASLRALAAAVIVVAIGFLLGTAYGMLVRHVVGNATIDVVRVDFARLNLDAFLLQAGLLLMLIAGLAFLGACATLGFAWLRIGPTPRLSPIGIAGGWPLAVALLPTVAAAVTISYPILLHAQTSAVRNFYEENLMPRVMDHRELRRAALLRAAEAIEDDDRLAESLAASQIQDPKEVAFDAWVRTPLADEGFDSSLELLDADHKVVSRFSLNMPLSTRGGEHVLEGEPAVEEEILETGGERTPMVHSWRPIRYNGETVGFAVLHVLDTFTNLPFLTATDPYSRAFRGGRRSAPEELAGGPSLLYVYDDHGVALGPSAERAPTLPPDIGRPLLPGVWRRVQSLAGEPLDLLFSAGPQNLFALGHPAADLVDRVGGFVRLLLLHVGAAAVLLGVGWLLAAARSPHRLRPRDLVAGLARSYYRRLFVNFVAASLLPLLLLAFFLERYVSREIRQEVVGQGVNALEISRRILSRVLTEGDELPEAPDEMLELLRELVGQELHLYVGGELTATSRRDLDSAGLLARRLDPETYRSIVVEGRPHSAVPARIARIDHTLLAVPLDLPGARERGVLVLPIGLRSAEIEARVAKVGQAILIATALLVILFAATGFVVSRRIAAPIRGLAAAAMRLARGDLDTRVEVHTRDETATLVESFNTMAQALRARDAELRQNLLYIEKILRNATTGVVSLDAEGRVVTSNPAAARLLDLEEASLSGRELRALIATTSRAPLLAWYEATASMPRDERRTEVVLGADGAAAGSEPRRLRAALIPFPFEEGGEGQILLLEDVTEVARANRLSAWAEMARQIAHEVKNPLTPIQLAAGHLRRAWSRRGAGPAGVEAFAATLDECVEIIQDQVRRLREIASDFSTYARIPEIRRQPIAPERFLKDVLGPYAASLPDGVHLVRQVDPDLPTLSIDAPLLRRALVNLVENSLQAMPNGGTVRVTATGLARDGAPGVEIVVADNGVGIDDASLSRLFEPYFSTKAGGTGLGLAIARRAVREHGGDIRAESVPGAGTTFRVWLPLTES